MELARGRLEGGIAAPAAEFPEPVPPEARRPGFLPAPLAIDPVLGRRIVTLAVPVILAMLSQTAINLVDTILLKYLPAEEGIPGQSALAISLPLLWAVGGFLSAISVGTQAITARRFGAGDPLGAGRVLTNSLSVALLSGLVFSVAGWFLAPLIFPFFHTNETVVALGSRYCQWRLVGVLSMVMTIGSKSFFDGIGKTYVHMVAAIVMNITNLFLAWCLVFGKLGLPAMGVEGAGIAAVASSYIGLVIVLAWTLLPRFRNEYRYYRLSNLDRSTAWEIIRLSVPSGAATVFVMTGFLIFLKIVAIIDHRAVEQVISGYPGYAAHTGLLRAAGELGLPGDFGRAFVEARVAPIYTTGTKVIIDIMSITFMSCIAYGTATATLVSQSLGAKKPELAERFGWESAKIAMYVFGALGLFTAVFPDVLLRIFQNDPEVLAAARPSLRMLGVIEALVAAAIVFTQALSGAGNTRYVMKVELTLHMLCLVPLAYLFGLTLGWGLFGVWLAAAVYVILLFVFMGWKFREGSWKEIRL
jgi:MATE family multidrug resistance protein